MHPQRPVASCRESCSGEANARGAVSVESAFGMIIFISFVAFILDFGILVHKRSRLLDVTLKTVQHVTRDPHAAVSSTVLQERTAELFEEWADRLDIGGPGRARLVDVQVACASQQVQVVGEWTTPCLFCFFGKFRNTLRAQSIGLLESPIGSLDCAPPEAPAP